MTETDAIVAVYLGTILIGWAVFTVWMMYRVWRHGE